MNQNKINLDVLILKNRVLTQLPGSGAHGCHFSKITCILLAHTVTRAAGSSFELGEEFHVFVFRVADDRSIRGSAHKRPFNGPTGNVQGGRKNVESARKLNRFRDACYVSLACLSELLRAFRSPHR